MTSYERPPLTFFWMQMSDKLEHSLVGCCSLTFLDANVFSTFWDETFFKKMQAHFSDIF